MAEKKEVIGRLQLIAASLIWGTSFMFVKTAQEEFQPFVLMALRLSIAAAVLGIVFIKKLKGLNRQYIWRGAILGFCLAGGMGLQAMGLNYMSPGTNAFLTASYCLFLPFFAWALTRKRPDIWKFCGSIICLAGIGLVSLENDLSIGEGSLITVSSGLMYAGQMACASVFVKNGVKILRIGLHSSENLAEAPFGAKHPALGELVMSEIYYKEIRDALGGAGDNVVVYVPLGCVSKAVGQHRANAVRLENETGKRLSFREDKSLPEYKIRIETN